MQRGLILAVTKTVVKTKSLTALKLHPVILWLCSFYQTCKMQPYGLDKEGIRFLLSVLSASICVWHPFWRLSLSLSFFLTLSLFGQCAHCTHSTYTRHQSDLLHRTTCSLWCAPACWYIARALKVDTKRRLKNVTGLLHTMDCIASFLHLLSAWKSEHTVWRKLTVKAEVFIFLSQIYLFPYIKYLKDMDTNSIHNSNTVLIKHKYKLRDKTDTRLNVWH